MPEDSKRARVLMQEKIRQARDQMAPITTEFEISREDMEKFCAAIVVDDLGATFVHLAAQIGRTPRSMQNGSTPKTKKRLV